MSSQAIVLIPGIKGTKLVNTSAPAFDTIWSGVQSNFETIEDLEFTKPVDHRYFEEEPTAIIKPGEVEGLAYSEFVRDLRTEKPIYVFSYDWRLSASQNGERFDGLIEELIGKSKASTRMVTMKKIDVVTHSLGNFILRAYIKQHGFGKINKVVFTVPPFKGSLEIVTAILAGEDAQAHPHLPRRVGALANLWRCGPVRFRRRGGLFQDGSLAAQHHGNEKRHTGQTVAGQEI